MIIDFSDYSIVFSLLKAQAFNPQLFESRDQIKEQAIAAGLKSDFDQAVMAVINSRPQFLKPQI